MIETLSLLFTDIEGSTSLLRRLGDDLYGRALADHRELVRGALREGGGAERDTQGDSFFATFSSPRACVTTAIEIQRAIEHHQWPQDERLRVRIGVHTGEVAETSAGVVGYEIHRAARIMAVAHGGQVVLSSAIAGLVDDALPSDVGLRNLGAHRLKDLGRPETLLQLVIEGLENEFAPVRSLDNPELPNNLPASLSPFVGRSEEVAEVVGLVDDGRLVTLTGAGGSGKTRLALQVAAEMLDGSGDGVWLIELAPISDPDHVPVAVGEALALRMTGGTDPLTSLLGMLRDQRVLLVLDNCEHLVDAVAKLTDQVLRACPKVSVIATTREPLGVDGEQVYRVRSLSLPATEVETAAELGGSDAAELFVARAALHDSSFELTDDLAAMVASLCRRLDGIPLAIELAAARLSSMSLDDLHQRLDQRFRLLTGGSRNALPRQQTLEATVAWSYDLLTEPERSVLRRLSVFVGSFDLAAAEAICADGDVDAIAIVDVIGSLVNKSLLFAERAQRQLRYGLLETIRQYAADQLVSIDGAEATASVRQRCAEYFLALSEDAEHRLRSGDEEAEWYRRLDDEWGNIASALALFSSDPSRATDVLRLVSALWRYLFSRQIAGPDALLQQALDRADDAPPRLRCVATLRLGVLTTFVLSRRGVSSVAWKASERLVERAAEMAAQLDDRALLCESKAWHANLLWFLDDLDRARLEVTEASEMASALGDGLLFGHAEQIRAEIDDDWVAAEPHFRAAMRSYREARNAYDLSECLFSITYAMPVDDLDDVHECEVLIDEALEIQARLGAHRLNALLRGRLSIMRAHAGDLVGAEELARRSLRELRRRGFPPFTTIPSLTTLAVCASQGVDTERAARLWGAVQELNRNSEVGLLREGSLGTALEERSLAGLREALGDEVLERLLVEGASLHATDAYALALGIPVER